MALGKFGKRLLGQHTIPVNQNKPRLEGTFGLNAGRGLRIERLGEDDLFQGISFLPTVMIVVMGHLLLL